MFRSEREAKQFYASPAVAWFLPFISAILGGLFSSYLVGVVTYYFVDSTRAFITALVTFGVVAFLIWARLTWIIFGKLGMTQPGIRTLRIEWKEDNNLRFAHFDSVNEDELKKICEMIINNGSLSFRNLRTILDQDDSRVTEFRLELAANRLAVFDMQNECKLTPRGVKFMRNIVHYPTERVSDA